jgi:hypothetical protein
VDPLPCALGLEAAVDGGETNVSPRVDALVSCTATCAPAGVRVVVVIAAGKAAGVRVVSGAGMAVPVVTGTSGENWAATPRGTHADNTLASVEHISDT